MLHVVDLVQEWGKNYPHGVGLRVWGSKGIKLVG